jgi:3-oxoacyl-[acyl-carrier protein] reductase
MMADEHSARSPKLLASKVAVVTGGGRGMGKTIAETLAAEGAKVVIGARTLSYGEQTLDEFRDNGYEARVFQADIGRREDCRGLVDFAVAEFGGVDILVHCAADIPHGSIRDLPEEDFHSCIDSILGAAFWLTKDAIPHLEKSGAGRIIYISSVCGSKTAIPGMAHYGAAKAGLDAFARGAALELGAAGITVNTINPGLIASDRMRERLPTEYEQALCAGFPIARSGTTQEVADLVVFLASPKAGYITGESIVLDGGSTLSTSDIP